MRREWEEKHKVTEETSDGPPSQRANATLTPCPSGNYLWCIGGEYFSDDGKAVGGDLAGYLEQLTLRSFPVALLQRYLSIFAGKSERSVPPDLHVRYRAP